MVVAYMFLEFDRTIKQQFYIDFDNILARKYKYRYLQVYITVKYISFFCNVLGLFIDAKNFSLVKRILNFNDNLL